MFERFRDSRLIGVVVVVLIVAIMIVTSRVRAIGLEPAFRESLSTGAIRNLPLPVQALTWDDEDFDTVSVRAVPTNIRSRAFDRLIPFTEDIHVSGSQFDAQACITDVETNMRYVFGRSRTDGAWVWTSIHPDSIDLHIQRRGEDVERIKAEAEAANQSQKDH